MGAPCIFYERLEGGLIDAPWTPPERRRQMVASLYREFPMLDTDDARDQALVIPHPVVCEGRWIHCLGPLDHSCQGIGAAFSTTLMSFQFVQTGRDVPARTLQIWTSVAKSDDPLGERRRRFSLLARCAAHAVFLAVQAYRRGIASVFGIKVC